MDLEGRSLLGRRVELVRLLVTFLIVLSSIPAFVRNIGLLAASKRIRVGLRLGLSRPHHLLEWVSHESLLGYPCLLDLAAHYPWRGILGVESIHVALIGGDMTGAELRLIVIGHSLI